MMMTMTHAKLAALFLLSFCFFALPDLLAAAPHSLLNFLHDYQIVRMNVFCVDRSHSVRALGTPRRRTRLAAFLEFSCCSISNMMKTSVVRLSHFSRCENEERNPKKTFEKLWSRLTISFDPNVEVNWCYCIVCRMKLSVYDLKLKMSVTMKSQKSEQVTNWWDKFVMVH